MKKQLLLFLFTPLVFAKVFNLGNAIPESTNQLIVVTKKPNKPHDAWFRVYRRNADGFSWQKQLYTMKAEIGAKGVAKLGDKQNFDKKTPAGIFKIDSVYGYFPDENIKYLYWSLAVGKQEVTYNKKEDSDYKQNKESKVSLTNLDEKTFNKGVVDLMPLKIVKSEENDVKSSDINQYGLVVNYNKGLKKNNQAVFVYSWKNSYEGTDGSIAISKRNMFRLINWLAPVHKPYIYIQE